MKSKVRFNLQGTARGKGDGTVSLSEALSRRGLGSTPVIGVMASLKEEPESPTQDPLDRFVRTDLDYVESVADAGGEPVVIPPSADLRIAKALLEGLDGLLLSGGPDLDPGYYGEAPIVELGMTIPEWDALEMALLRSALQRGIPIFGICRGMQILNVALGGTLYQDMPSQLGVDVLDHRQESPKYEPTHEVEILDFSYMAEIIDRQSVEVNSHHHQGINVLANALTVTARSSDGVIEAVESCDFSNSWLMGVQWHPEGMGQTGPGHRNLFEAHVCAAERHSLRRAAA
jgi:putative glutamine amidotransferase